MFPAPALPGTTLNEPASCDPTQGLTGADEPPPANTSAASPARSQCGRATTAALYASGVTER